MGGATLFAQADTLLFGPIDYDLSGPSEINPGHKQTPAFCVFKVPGQLDFVLSSKLLGVNLPFDFHVQFVGSVAGQTPGGDDIVV